MLGCSRAVWHCHTTRSDGRGTPEEVIRLHAEHGYDFSAITDHRKYNYRNFAPETGITILPGMEMDRNLRSEYGYRCFHTVCIGPEKEQGNAYEQDQVFESGFVKDQYEYQAVLDEIHAAGNLTIYCHPDWSGTPAHTFAEMKGNFAMEIWNTGCVVENEMDVDNGLYWDELLMRGVKIYAVATDDGHPMYQHCKGWVCANARNNVAAILEALKNGAFYSSTGPEIRDFSIEDGVARVARSPWRAHRFPVWRFPQPRSAGRWYRDGRMQSAGRRATRYLRARVVDAQGQRAWTNPILGGIKIGGHLSRRVFSRRLRALTKYRKNEA